MVSRHAAGKPVSYDVGGLVAEVVEVLGGRVKCRLCGRVVRLSLLKHHLQSKHCGELLALLEVHKPRRLATTGGGGRFEFSIEFYCTACNWRYRVAVKSYKGPPNVRKLLGKLGLTSCPQCGRRFEVRGFEFR
jgi:hypothetical protein